MKKIIIYLACGTFFLGCSSGTTTSSNNSPSLQSGTYYGNYNSAQYGKLSTKAIVSKGVNGQVNMKIQFAAANATVGHIDGSFFESSGVCFYGVESYLNNTDSFMLTNCSRTNNKFHATIVRQAISSSASSLQQQSVADTIDLSQLTSSYNSGGIVPGWPNYIAMGNIGGPDGSTLNCSSSGGNDDFQNRPIDAVFKYAGNNGAGDLGTIDPSINSYLMTQDFNTLSGCNAHPTRVVMVEYTAMLSNGVTTNDFTNLSTGTPVASTADSANTVDASYIMAKHFATIGADVMQMQANPVIYNSESIYGSVIISPDALGTIQQQTYVSTINTLLGNYPGSINTAVAQALCFLTNQQSYTYNGTSYTGTPVSIMNQILKAGYPVANITSTSQCNGYWNTCDNNSGSQASTWFAACASNPTYPNEYQPPEFPDNLDGWIQAQNWLVHTLGKGNITFGYQDNMWADGAVNGSNFWLSSGPLTGGLNYTATTYAGDMSSWLKTNVPHATQSVSGYSYAPHFFVFDRYEQDDSFAPNYGTLYNADSWDNYMQAIGLVSNGIGNGTTGMPIMMWQIPGSHISNTTESQPEVCNAENNRLCGGFTGGYMFSTAPVYFFGDSNLMPNLSNIISSNNLNASLAVGAFVMTPCQSGQWYSNGYNCSELAVNTYQNWLLYSNGLANNFDWSIDNQKLGVAQQSNVFAILWGGGNTTGVIQNFSNGNDNGWLANKIINYYSAPSAQPWN